MSSEIIYVSENMKLQDLKGSLFTIQCNKIKSYLHT